MHTGKQFGRRAARHAITETYLGTYADAVITPAGQIILIDARSLPTSSVLVFLDGLSDQP
jgi:hypothetical protein